jgi:hypothetical protein
MLTKEQANTVADSFSAQRLASKNAAAAPVPRRYQCEELKQLEPWQRAETLREAKRRVKDNWRINVALAAWVAAWLLVWYLIGSAARAAVPFYLLAILCLAPQFTVRATLVRREVKIIARQLVGSREI